MQHIPTARRAGPGDGRSRSLPRRAGEAARGRRPAAGTVDFSQLKLPAGFSISLFAEGVPSARQMVIGAKGTVFVGSRTARNVYALVDRNRDHKVDEVKIIATGLTQPSGIAIRNGSLYVAAITRILRYDDIENKLDAPPEPVVVYDQLPNKGGHTWRFIAFGPDGLLYVGVGAPCNVCESLDDPRLVVDHPHEAGRHERRSVRARRAQHGRLRLASDDARAVVHRQRPRRTGRRRAER